MPKTDTGWLLDDSELDRVIYSEVCVKCKHLSDIIAHKCNAFSLIPDEIWNGTNNHTSPYSGDNGIQFEVIN